MADQPAKLSREEIAKIEIGRTQTTPAICWFLTLLFLATIGVIPLLQNVMEFGELARTRRDAKAAGLPPPTRRLPQCWDVVGLLPSWPEVRGVATAGGPTGMFRAARTVNNRILRDIKQYEDGLKDHSAVVQWLIPHMQAVVTGRLKGGNEDAYCGREDWLFYRRDLDYLTGRGFLDPASLKARRASGSQWQAPPQPDPVRAIVDFRDQLASRGIELVLMPVPVKPMIYPEQYSRRYRGSTQPLQNPSYAELRQRLEAARIRVFDPAAILMAAKADASAPLYLETDTHWTPAGMGLVAWLLTTSERTCGSRSCRPPVAPPSSGP